LWKSKWSWFNKEIKENGKHEEEKKGRMYKRKDN
jgi:hypothetical protein